MSIIGSGSISPRAGQHPPDLEKYPIKTTLSCHAGIRWRATCRAARGTIGSHAACAALIMIETSDLIFALDSIPAIFSITRDPFLVFTSNVMTLLGLRSLYFALAGAVDQFRYLRISLGLLLVLIDRN
jgi:tellurite resistance protein TerC